MRTGYLDALAARTLGTAPLLLPATLSRFEPDGPGALAFGEAETMAEAPAVPEPGRPPVAGQAPRTPEPSEALRSPARWPATPRRVPPAADLPAQYRAPAAQSAGEPVANDGAGAWPPPGWPDERLPRPAAPWTRTVPASTAPVPAPPPGSPGAPAEAGQTAHPAPGHQGDPPPVVVRIGRVEVRAVHAAPPPVGVLPARQAPTAGPSLADHLLARERGLRR
ncbi:MAG TPA: hypothetical protein VFW71_13875 [Actinomycetota bacterium]|nr:hypothetical protein [Actinomycetota bacterium]